MPRRLSLRPSEIYTSLQGRLSADEQARLERAEQRFEYTVGTFNIMVQIMYLVGSVFFLGVMSTTLHMGGIWLFIVGGFLSTLISLSNTRDTLLGYNKSETGYDMFENLCYTGAGIGFFVGALLWLPPLYESEQRSEFLGHAWGAWLFISGSLFLVLATFLNTIGVEREAAQLIPRAPPYIRRLATFSLACGTLSGAVFVAASFLFRPGFENECTLSGNHLVWQHGVLYHPDDARLPNDVFLPGRTHTPSPDAVAHLDQEGSGGAGRTKLAALQRGAALLAPDELAPDEPKKKQKEPHKESLVATLKVDTGEIAVGRPDESNVIEQCVSVLETGTWLFILGSAFALVQCVLQVVCSYLMAKERSGAPRPARTDDASEARASEKLNAAG